MARKKRVYVEPKQNTVIFLYTSLMLILLTFFIVLCSMSVQDERKQRMAIDSVLGSFGILPSGRSATQNPGGADLLSQAAPLREQIMQVRKIRSTLSENGIISGAAVSEGVLGVTITLKSNLLFKSGTDEFAPESAPVLNTLAEVLSSMDNPIAVTGHTDSIPYEGPPFYSNWALSAARAVAVVNYLAGRGIDQERLAAYGLGAQRPITSNSDAYGRALNRRVEITILGDIRSSVSLKGLDTPSEKPTGTLRYKGYDFKLDEW
ncbi:MAG: OmpA family protein [Desulfomonilia bacterium]|jgi:chemotaxis protein MotB|uniref:Motility protein B n=1 Tax=anaerobic digester metagenome TaxID=1263854 RepID=A0A485M6U1_9ZZZZ|nr:OmpA family protein [Pseudomonadota bacterium]HPD20852.1 OmpA family protein [Deltaproteobacteria bacterium]HPX19046.1 OmpA family protein [Deltaproteobacteria bacterium]HRS55673.1 OmpA family protein [Desulfomonilia bacterium]HRV35396.1 OmpA family protein [Desulfomonilia bacterium]